MKYNDISMSDDEKKSWQLTQVTSPLTTLTALFLSKVAYCASAAISSVVSAWL